jgi:integrase
MPKLELNDRLIATMKAEGSAIDLFDAKTKGLNLRIAPSGVKTWFLVYTSPIDGKRARVALGHYPATPLARARAVAIETRGRVEAGEDPRNSPKVSGAMTVADLCELYISKHCPTIKTGAELRRRLRADVIPAIGTIKLSELHRRDLHRVLDPKIGHGKRAAAGKAFGDLRAMIRWAVARGDLDGNPIEGAKRPVKSKPRERFLEPEEIAVLWKVWPTALPASVALALKLALVTGQRIGEVAGISLDEIDFPKALWNLPADRTKNGFAHTVPLSEMALDLIADARKSAIGGRLFRLNTQRVANLINQNRDRIQVKHWTAHDLRRTVCTHMAKMGISPLVIGAVVNHRTQTKGGVTLGVYVQYDYAREKREALDMWADRLAAIVRGGAAKLIHMRGHGAA